MEFDPAIFDRLREKSFTTECSICGKEHHRKNEVRFQSYCESCHAAYMREHRPKHSELTPEQKFKANSRAYANTYQRRGHLVAQCCERCGSSGAEKHHEDYAKPLEVNWLCRPCHLEMHSEQELEPLD